jgi:DNA-binding GntR family transcriptional regulator
MTTIPLDRYVLETLMPDLVSHDRRPSAFIVYLALWSRTGGARQRGVPLSLRELAESTGLSKRTVQDALRKLVRRKLVSVERDGPTAIPAYSVLRPWVRRKS